VIAHEVVHVLGRHTYAAHRDARRKNLIGTLIGAGLNIGGGLFGAGWGSALSVAGTALPVLLEVNRRGYAQEMERAADAFGVDLAIAAGFDPRGLSRALQRLKIPELDADLELYYTDHPSLDERTQWVDALVEARGAPAAVAEDAVLARGRYRPVVESATRDAITLAIAINEFRLAVRFAESLAQRGTVTGATQLHLGEAFRHLGPRAVDTLSREERADRTPGEVAAGILKRDGADALLDNFERARGAYEAALALDPALGRARLGLTRLDATLDEYISMAMPAGDVQARAGTLKDAIGRSLKGERSHETQP
jgi:predicted Zn-dependent protease